MDLLEFCELMTDLSDDLNVLVKLGIIKQSFDGNWFWLVSILLNLKSETNNRNRLKLLCDLIFVSCDIIDGKEVVQVVAGLLSAVLSLQKLINKM